MNYSLSKGFDELNNQYIVQKMSISMIANADKVTSTTIRKALNYWNIPIRHKIKLKTTPDVKKRQVNKDGFITRIGRCELYNLYIIQNLSGPQIANKFKVNSTLVYEALNYWDIKKQIKPFYEIIGKAQLYESYCVDGESTQVIANNWGVEVQKVLYAMKHWNISCFRRMSSYERLIGNFLRTIGVTNILCNSRDVIAPLELDIYLPDYKLAIEVNGEYWHSTVNKSDRQYHKNKTIMCRNKGITLLQFWGRDIVDKKQRQIVYNLITNHTTCTEIVFIPIETQPRNIYDVIGFEFFNINSLYVQQCDDPVFYGIYKKGEIVAAIMVDDSPNKDSLIIHNFACKTGTYVVDAFKKLIRFLEQSFSLSYIYGQISGQLYVEDNIFTCNGFIETTWTDPQKLTYDQKTCNICADYNYTASNNRTLDVYDCGLINFIKHFPEQ